MNKKSIAEIREELKNTRPEQLEEHMAPYRTDQRKGVQNIIKTQEKRLQIGRASCRERVS